MSVGLLRDAMNIQTLLFSVTVEPLVTGIEPDYGPNAGGIFHTKLGIYGMKLVFVVCFLFQAWVIFPTHMYNESR